MTNTSKYSFRPVDTCNMCQAGKEKQKHIGFRLNRSQGLEPQKKKGIAVSVFKCRQCGLIYSNPRPEPININDHYGVDPE